jgi:hypothetical protein
MTKENYIFQRGEKERDYAKKNRDKNPFQFVRALGHE